jgi:hypothetical protein
MEEFRPIISGIIGGTIATIAIAWAAKDSRTSIARDTAAYGWRMRFLAIGISCICLLLVYVAVKAAKGQELASVVLGAVSLLIAVAFPLEAFITRFSVLDTGLHARTPWRGTRLIPWDAIGPCNYRPALEVHEIKTRGFGRIFLSKQLSGISELLVTINRRGSWRAS